MALTLHSLVAFILSLTSVSAFALGTYSDGYRMGVLTSCSVRTLPNTLECSLSLGVAGTPLDVQEGDSVITVNPFYFSGAPTQKGLTDPLQGQLVVVHYNHEQVNASLSRTGYTLLDIMPVTNSLPDLTEYSAANQHKYGYSHGDLKGRIVKASLSGRVLKTWEILVQVGDAGNVYRQFSVEDEKLYDHIVNCLKSGLAYNISYVQVWIKMDAGKSSYRITHMAPAAAQPSQGK